GALARAVAGGWRVSGPAGGGAAVQAASARAERRGRAGDMARAVFLIGRAAVLAGAASRRPDHRIGTPRCSECMATWRSPRKRLRGPVA
ncbi:hypothetical protein, partial [Salibaculum halophilum]|uniref:hypothetical protein n=1 Tax=Salibaculum halophilum TaxID=1914408 RepID=UPI001C4EE293